MYVMVIIQRHYSQGQLMAVQLFIHLPPLMALMFTISNIILNMLHQEFKWLFMDNPQQQKQV